MKSKEFILSILIILGLYFPLFLHLELWTIRIWDEARVALNSYEMYKSGNYLVSHYMGHHDMWNTKPPLFHWMQVVCMHLFGVGELAVRLPAALSGFFTCCVIIYFSKKYFGHYIFGILAAFVLVTSPGFVGMHGTRTGDYDALLCLFTTSSALMYFYYLENINHRPKLIFWVILSLGLGVLTKSIAPLLFGPAFLLYTLYSHQLRSVLNSRYFYFGIGVFLLMTIGFYLAREGVNPGYLRAVYENELGGRYLSTIEGHTWSLGYYAKCILTHDFTYWLIFLPIGLIAGWKANGKFKKFTAFLFFFSLTFFLVISFSGTKLEWYNMPMFPFLSMIVATALYHLFLRLKKKYSNFHFKFYPHLIVGILYLVPYIFTVSKNYFSKENNEQKERFYEISYYLRDAAEGKTTLQTEHLLNDGYKAHLVFYTNIINDNGTFFGFKDWKNLQNGEKVTAYQDHIKKYLDQNYNYEILGKTGNIVNYYILHRKK